jgi:tyrosyl-DNA phosphodiesterase 2
MEEFEAGIYVFRGNRWTEDVPSAKGFAARNLTLLTFNAWFMPFGYLERSKALLEIIRFSDADIIGLQEVTPELLEMILEQDWVRKDYLVSDFQGRTVGPHGVLLLSRLPIRSLVLYNPPSALNRKLLIAELLLNSSMTKIAVCHLDSRKKNAHMRAEQLTGLFPLMEDAPHAILMGDFNFDPDSTGETSNMDGRYEDMWSLLKPDNPGFTIDTDINTMRLEQKGEPKKVRFDRILVRSGSPGWRPESIRLLGTDPIKETNPAVFPSDHFGLMARLKWDAAR